MSPGWIRPWLEPGSARRVSCHQLALVIRAPSLGWMLSPPQTPSCPSGSGSPLSLASCGEVRSLILSLQHPVTPVCVVSRAGADVLFCSAPAPGLSRDQEMGVG